MTLSDYVHLLIAESHEKSLKPSSGEPIHTFNARKNRATHARLRAIAHGLVYPQTPTLKVELIHPNARLPEYGTDGAAGMDIFCPEKGRAPVGCVTLIPLGIKVAIPKGYEGQIRLRSSAGARGVIIPNAPATIDSDYRGELVIQVLPLVKTLLWAQGNRLCQLVIAPVARMEVTSAPHLSGTWRGEGGFGSTGR